MPRVMRVQAGKHVVTKQGLEQAVHRYFQSLNSEEHPVEEFVSPAVKLFDNTNQSVHESLPVVREVSDVTDTTHKCVAAHYVAQGTAGADVSGTYVFKFDDAGLIIEIVAYQDSDEEEFLEA
eukprot:gene1247-1587_t